MSTAASTSSRSPLAPLRHSPYRWLWLAMMISGMGSWAQTVGAQWLFVHDPNGAAIVSLVQTATMLPAMLLGLPAGVLADMFDRRLVLLGVQVYSVTVGVLLTALTLADRMPPLLLLAFTFAVGCGAAVGLPTWQPLITELVPRDDMAAAARLDMVSVNVARAVGPAVAGVVIAGFGVPFVFGFNVLTYLPILTALLLWRRPRTGAAQRERFLPALRAGGRFVRHEPVVRLIIGRLALFVVPASALWALLPVIATQRLGLDAGGYGLLFSALGVGAVVGALTLGAVKRWLSSNAVLGVSALTYGVALALLLVGPLPVALLVLVLAGYGWTATASTLVAELQLYLPGWVRARATAIYLMTFTGSMALASPVWGLLAQGAGLVAAVLAAAVLVALNTLVGVVLRVRECEGVDRTPVAYWSDSIHLLEPDPDAGPVAVEVELDVAPGQEEAFLAAMQQMRRSRQRSGAFRWELYRVPEVPGRYVELFHVASWEEHLMQHRGRLTAEDQAIEEHAFSHLVRPPRARHLLPPGALPGQASPDGTGPT